MITKKLLEELFEYQEDGTLVRKVTTNRRALAGTVSGTPSKAGYLRTTVLGRSFYNHRIIWFMHHGSWPLSIDHINGDKRDNRIENLREATGSQNQHNKGLNRNNKTGVKGVTWRVDRNRYRARIKVFGKDRFLGDFLSLDEARRVVEDARRALHGEYANNG
jgi:hypothetical protein